MFVSNLVQLILLRKEDIVMHEMRSIIEQHGIDLAEPTRCGSNILHDIGSSSLRGSRHSVLGLVTPYKPDVNATDKDGWTPLLRMLVTDYTWHEDFFWWLLEHGADVSKPIKGGPSSRFEYGINSLHLTIAALQEVPLSDSRSCYNGLDSFFTLADIPAQAGNNAYRGFGQCNVPFIEADRRQLKKRFLKSLISRGVDLHAVARHWGTPTDKAKYTGNSGVLVQCPGRL